MEEGLKIGFDAKRAAANTTGLGNYSRLVIDAMSIMFPRNEYRLYTPRQPRKGLLDTIIGRENIKLEQPAAYIGRHLGSIWRTWGITAQLRKDDISVYHGLSNELPLNIARSGIPSVVTIHDLIYRRVPQDYSAIDRRIYDYKYSHSARNATRIIAISECTRRDLVNDYGIDPVKIDVIYQGCAPQFHARLDSGTVNRVREKYNLPGLFYISVGTVQSRKNQLLAVKALRGLPKEISLVIAGRRTKEYAGEIDCYIRRNNLAGRIIWLEHADFEDLPYLYSMAIFSSYTSRYEGFGIPVVESLASGTPVIAATGSCLEEAGGRGGIYVDPDDADMFIHHARTLIEDPYRRDKLVELGRRHIRKFNAGEFARLNMATYRKAIVESIF